MLELNVRKTFGNLERRVHITERGSEDEVGALAGKTGNGALRIRPFAHFLHIQSLDLIAKLFLDGKSSLIVLVGPAVVADRANVYESYFYFFAGHCDANCQ